MKRVQSEKLWSFDFIAIKFIAKNFVVVKQKAEIASLISAILFVSFPSQGLSPIVVQQTLGIVDGLNQFVT